MRSYCQRPRHFYRVIPILLILTLVSLLVGGLLGPLFAATMAPTPPNGQVVVSGSHIYNQNEKQINRAQANHTITWTFSAAKNHACGAGDYSGCSYQSDGFLLAVDDFNRPWEGDHVGYYRIDAYQPFAKFVLDANDWVGKYLVWNITGQDPVKVTWENFLTFTPEEPSAPAPVPLPAAGLLLLVAVALLRFGRTVWNLPTTISNFFHVRGSAWAGHDDGLEPDPSIGRTQDVIDAEYRQNTSSLKAYRARPNPRSGFSFCEVLI